jgi:hypothetical protein
VNETRSLLEAGLSDLATYLDDPEKDIPLEVLQAWHETFAANSKPVRYDPKTRVWLEP